MGTIILTAAGFYNPKTSEFVKSKLKTLPNEGVAIITTASKEKGNDRYAQLAQKQLLEIGYAQVDFLDLERPEDIPRLSQYSTFYVCGGNTFKLLAVATKTDFKKAVQGLLEKGGLYIGVSAGTILLGPSIQIANEVQPDINEIGMTNFDAFNFVDETISPHYEASHEEEVRTYELKHGVKVTRLTNEQSIVFEQGARKLIN